MKGLSTHDAVGHTCEARRLANKIGFRWVDERTMRLRGSLCSLICAEGGVATCGVTDKTDAALPRFAL